LTDHGSQDHAGRVFEKLAARHAVPVVPLFCEVEATIGGRHVVYVLIGDALPAGAAVPDVQAALERLRQGFAHRRRAGEPLLPREMAMH
jgi:hypothetical protein